MENPATREGSAKSLLALGLETEPQPESSPCQPIRELARGGMGVIWDARDPKLQRQVAMKVMKQPHAGTVERQRFIQEARVLGQLAHPNIVPIYDMGTDSEGRPFYTMKLVQGSTLQDILNRLRSGDPETVASYPLPALLIILQKVCDAMSFAHARGVVHRDLKPQNIMVGEFGEVLVMDWGLAKRDADASTEPERAQSCPPPAASPRTPRNWIESPPTEATLDSRPNRKEQDAAWSTGCPDDSGLDGSAGRTLEGTVMGTPHYMAPEQAAGRQDEVGALSDVFSLGGILYAILTLQPPVQGDSREDVLARARQGAILPPVQRASGSSSAPATDPSRPSTSRPTTRFALPHLPGGRVPPALAAVAMRCLAAVRSQRYPSVAALSTDLAAYQAGFPTQAEQAGAFRQIQLLMGRHRVATIALASIVILCLGFVTRLIVSERRAERNAEAATLAKTSAETSAEATRKALARSQISLAEVAYRELDSGTMIRILDLVPRAYRDGDWSYLRRHADNAQAVLDAGPGHFYIGAAPHPIEPGLFALASTEPALHLVDVRTGERRGQITLSPRQAHTHAFRSLDFSPDGTRLLVGGLTDGDVTIYDVATGRPTVEWDNPGTEWVQFGTDGARALTINLRQQLTVRDTRTGQALWSHEPCNRATFVDADRILAASGDQLTLLDAATGAILQSLPRAHAPIFRLAISPDRTTVFYTAPDDAKVRGQRLSDGELIFERPLTDDAGRWPAVAVSGDGHRVLGAITVADHKTIIRVWDVSSGAQLQTLRGHHCPVETLAMHPRSENVVATGTESRGWALDNRPADWQLPRSSWGGEFLGTDDLIFAAGRPKRLISAGRWDDPFAPLPSPFTGSLHTASTLNLGLIGIRGSRSRGISGAEYLLVRTTTAGPTFTPGRLAGRNKVVIRIQPSPDGQHLAACDDYNGLSFHETSSGRLVSDGDPAASLRTLTSFAWLTPTRLVGIGSTLPRGMAENQERVAVWEAPAGIILHHRVHPTAMDCLAVLPNGTHFAEAGADQRVRIRTASDLAVRLEFRAHDGPIVALAAHPHQDILATASADLSIRLWRLPAAELLAEFPRAPAIPVTLSFSPSGNRLATTDQHGGVRIWDLGARASQGPSASPEPER